MVRGRLSATAVALAVLAAGCSSTPPSTSGTGVGGDDATSADAGPAVGTDADTFDATAIDGTALDGAGDASSGDAVPPDAGTADTAIADASGRGVVDSGLGPACHTSSECPAGHYCLGALGSSCMIGCPATQCTDSAQCEAGVCRSVHPTAMCAAGPGYVYCVPPCQTQDDCPTESICSQGFCSPQACLNGIACAPYAHCVGAGITALCVSNSCTTDGNCPQGYCVNGLCQRVLGSCAPSCD
jgi:hypothetical protein